MPKLKRQNNVAMPPPKETRVSSRRQASKDALKQMQLLLGDEETYEIPSDDDVRVVPVIEPSPPPPKKKYKLSHRKSSDGYDRDVIVLKSITNTNYVPKECTLDLECEFESLSEAQQEYMKKSTLDEIEISQKLKKLSENLKVQVVYNGNIHQAYSIDELIARAAIPKPQVVIPAAGVADPSNIQLVMDQMGVIVGAVAKGGSQISPNVPKSAPNPALKNTPATRSEQHRPKIQIAAAVKAAATITPQNLPQTRTRTRKSLSSSQPAMPPPIIPVPPLAIRTGVSNRMNNVQQNTSTTRNALPLTRNLATRSTPNVKSSTQATTASTPTKRSQIGQVRPKALVDLTGEPNLAQADTREVSFNKMQGKTYPSLVVVARPYLRVTDPNSDRKELDQKVKMVLIHPPNKFAEWLIQQGLLRAEQKCPLHSNNKLKLGIYSDSAKFPFSGGYVWIADCCPQRFVSVFNGSIFEGSPNPPSIMLKLIYHWACQTNIQNVIQWVKVDNLYVKGIYTWLRATCTVATQTHLRKLGGPGVRVECGVISLGTTNQEERRVKVEVLGILESTTKYVRLRAIEPTLDSEKHMKRRFLKILEPLMSWVDNTSIIVCDLTVDKATLHSMGFMNVHQTTSNEFTNSNRTIMEYLRRVVPRMFQNTLSILSRPIIQQFLDELVWREWFGTTSMQAFDNILAHLSEQTRLTNHTSLILKLNKVAVNPFKLWAMNVPQTQPQVLITASKAAPVTENKRGRTKKVVAAAPTQQSITPEASRPAKSVSPDIPEQMVPLENYYYGTMEPKVSSQSENTNLNIKCHYCKLVFTNNLALMNHLFKHAHNVTEDVYICRYCLTSVSTANELLEHVNKSHPSDTKFDNGFICLICETQFMNPFILGKHMSKVHCPHELPYKCGSCEFRCSNHKQVIDHFFTRHDGGNTIQCPFCLKSTTIQYKHAVVKNMQFFVQHLQKHQKKNLAKKCNKCNLWFIQKEMLRLHQDMHTSCRGKKFLVPWSAPRNGVMVPKSKIDRNPGDAEVINFSNLYYNLPSKSICKECDSPISSAKHFQQFNSCQNPNCQYSTCCANAMMTHSAKCKGLDCKVPVEKLPNTMYCVCGFHSNDGNSLAKHLALCEKKSAYPTMEAAKSATVTRSMLDVLGLVRKPDEVSSKINDSKKDKVDEIVIEDDDVEVLSNNEETKGDHDFSVSDNKDAKETDILKTSQFQNDDQKGGKENKENSLKANNEYSEVEIIEDETETNEVLDTLEKFPTSENDKASSDEKSKKTCFEISEADSLTYPIQSDTSGEMNSEKQIEKCSDLDKNESISEVDSKNSENNEPIDADILQ